MRHWHIALMFSLLLCCSGSILAQSFTYQGMLKTSGIPASGNYDFQFSLWTANSGGSQVGATLTRIGVSVSNGVFTTELDFGDVWDGNDRFLQIAVRPAGSGSYTTLSPRVKVNPTPYAVYAGSSGSSRRPWQTAGSNVFYNDGNVGVGTSSPFAPLSLGASNANTKLAIWQGGTASDVMGLGVGPAQFRLHLHNPSNRFSFLNAPVGSELMTILGNGNVGIGTSSPAERLHVNGNIRLANDSGIFGLGRLMGYNGLSLYGDATGGPDLFISPVGNVGIGTLDPHALLHVSGNAYFANADNRSTLQILPGNLFGQSQTNTTTLEIPGNGIIGVWDTLRTTGDLNVGGNYFSLGGGTDPTWSRVRALVSAAGGDLYWGAVETYGANGSINVVLTVPSDLPNHGYIAVYDAAGATQARMYVNGDGYGVLGADLKAFCVPDPEDATRDIWYGCIEGPEVAMYVRGTARLVNGRARIELPDHFRKLADEQGMTVQLTPLSPVSKGLCVVRKGLDGIEVAELLNGRGNYEFDWRVEAVRKEFRDFRVYRPWDEALPGDTDPAEAWQARLQSIQERQARQHGGTHRGVQR
jgi:hypothetical protein